MLLQCRASPLFFGPTTLGACCSVSTALRACMGPILSCHFLCPPGCLREESESERHPSFADSGWSARRKKKSIILLWEAKRKPVLEHYHHHYHHHQHQHHTTSTTPPAPAPRPYPSRRRREGSGVYGSEHAAFTRRPPFPTGKTPLLPAKSAVTTGLHLRVTRTFGLRLASRIPRIARGTRLRGARLAGREHRKMSGPSNASEGPAASEGDSSSSKPWAHHPLLARPLYAFGLPHPLLRSLNLRSTDVSVRESDEAEQQAQSAFSTSNGEPKERKSAASSAACAICPNVPRPKGPAQVRAHLRSDWHRYNAALARRDKHDEILGEEAFHNVVDELSSDEDSDEGSNDRETSFLTEGGKGREKAPQDPVATLLGRMRRMQLEQESDATDEEESRDASFAAAAGGVAREPHLWFLTRSGGEVSIPQTQIGVLRFLFPDSENEVVPRDWHINTLRRMQPGVLSDAAMRGAKHLKGATAAAEAAHMLSAVFLDASGEKGTIDEEDEASDNEDEMSATTEERSVQGSEQSVTSAQSQANLTRTWTIILLGGGDFAAITIALNPYERTISQRKGTSERQFLVVARKQFHRYTTRRKQGGAQSAQDASGRFAKSAGAQLRRYGEQQIGNEIRELLDTPQWRAAIQGSDRVWVRAGLRGARGVLWNWATHRESPLDELRRQDKVYSLPIATRKPTIGECLRCFAELTRVRVRHETEEDMAQRDAMYKAQIEGAMRARQERQEQRRRRLADKKQREADACKARANSGKAKKKLHAREQLRRERLVRLVDMIRKGRLANAINHLDKYEMELLGTAEEVAAGEPDDVDDSVDASRKRINAHLPDWWRAMEARQKGAMIPASTEASFDVDAHTALLSNRLHLIPATLLQVAAEGGHEDVVNYFLVERRSDPTISIPPPPAEASLASEGTTEAMSGAAANMRAAIEERFPHRTAYDLCSTRGSRDVFRRLMAAQPDWVSSWSGMERGGARVPKALTEEMEAARSKEDETRDRRTQMRERARQRQREAEVAQAHTITDDDRQANAASSAAASSAAPQRASSASTNRLGGPGSSGSTAPRAIQRQRDEAAGLTPEMRQRIEREKRARAAEARFKAMQGQPQ